MIGAIKRRWKSNKKCSDKDKEKVVPLHLPCTFPTSSRKNPVDFIHVNSGRIELLPGGVEGVGGERDWGPQGTHEARHSWCGHQQMGVPLAPAAAAAAAPQQSKESNKLDQLLEKITEIEKFAKEIPQIQPIVNQLKEELAQSMNRQEYLATNLESLHLRVNTLETHNKALANIILPTLIRLTKESKSSGLNGSNSTSVSTSTSIPKLTSKSGSSPCRTPTHTPTPTNTHTSGGSGTYSAKKSSAPRLALSCSSTTHPPKAGSSGSAAAAAVASGSSSTPGRALKSRLPIRKCSSSNSSQGPSSPTKVGVVGVVVGCETKVPKDEGYSTMSNGAIDSSATQGATVTTTAATQASEPTKKSPTTTTTNSSTFTRKKCPDKRTASSAPGPTGTWTKPRKGELLTIATATMPSPTSITKAKDTNVRIVAGTPKEIAFSKAGPGGTEGGGGSYEDGPVLWEDSDDSDILYLPIEVSSSGSESTLVPYPYSRSSYAPSTSTSATTPTPRETPTPTPTHKLLLPQDWGLGAGAGGEGGGEGGADEKDLVQRWMRLEDARNYNEENQQWWSWDWDGIINEKSSAAATSAAAALTPTPTGRNSWRKSKSTATPEPSDQIAAELDFTAEFYRLTSTTEDKTIQTEASSDAEGDLFLQCQNCLEKMSKLIDLHEREADTGNASGGNGIASAAAKNSYTEQLSKILRKTEGASSKWRLRTGGKVNGAAVDRTIELMSSTESEGLLSP